MGILVIWIRQRTFGYKVSVVYENKIISSILKTLENGWGKP